ncbi:hypothetical protein K1T71_011312 [Dendrolimus kikuchii]|uniref:Uncharacterized protein n=1 Tax=Dendrolimus kikuchii TaxID=765133 RepID=A0ACC1CNU9_9NEOP|nr:hypothetical protein K1T71_011312 [Dendrolimus kikuchii]
MEYIPEHPLLRYKPDTMIALRKKYNLHKPGDMDRCVDILKEWIKQQEHFTKKDFSKEQLERFLMTLKGSIERTKLQLDKLCTMKTLLSRFFESCNAKNDFLHIKNKLIVGILPGMTEDYYRVCIGKVLYNKVDSKALLSAFQLGLMICEYFKSFDYNDGVIAIADFRGIDLMEFVSAINFIDLREAIMIGMEGYDTRVKGIHFISNSKAVEILVKLIKQLLSKKISERVHVHNSNETLYEHVPRELLPTDYGGEEKQYKEICDDWTKELSTEKNVKFFEEMKNARTNETLRRAINFNENYIGMAGTFRNLTVD